MINIVELLKDCPKGTKLYSPLFGEVKLGEVNPDCMTDHAIYVISSNGGLRNFDRFGKFFYNHDGECLLFPSKDCRTWEGWKLPAQPNFKVGDWIAYNENKSSITPMQIIRITEDKYVVSGHWSYDFRTLETDWHLWTIADAKDGDVLVSGIDNPFIYDGNIEFSSAGAYVGVSRNGRIRLDMFPSRAWTSIKDVKPATKEQRDLLFRKMKEAGYEWDADKKELRKIRPHYDIANFRPKQWVLVRNSDNQVWGLSMFSHRDMGFYICLNREDFRQCIPFDGNERLLGATDMPSEEFINW